MDVSASGKFKIAILSDVHYAGAAEQARGRDYELRRIAHPLLRGLARLYRHNIWMRNPFAQSPQLDRFLNAVGAVDAVVANGDYTCDSDFVGLSDPAAFQSAQECIGKLRARFGDRIRFTLGDHELGKLPLFGNHGGMRLASWTRATETLGLPPFWSMTAGNYVLIGVTSSLLALPAHQTDTLPAEWPEWLKLREAHLTDIRAAFDALQPAQRVLLFCHDPTALPFLGREESVRRRLPQIEQTIIGHLHTRLILFIVKATYLLGFPKISFLGNSVKRFSSALHEAHYWKPFKVRLCPALSGIELLNDGGYLTVEIDKEANTAAKFIFHHLPRKK